MKSILMKLLLLEKKINLKIKKFDEWKARKWFSLTLAIDKTCSQNSDEYFEYRVELSESFNFMNNEKSFIKHLLARGLLLLVSIALSFFIDQKFIIIDPTKFGYEKVYMWFLYIFAIYFILRGIVDSILKLIKFKFTSHYLVFIHTVWQIIKTLITATSSYVVCMIGIYGFYNIFNLIFEKFSQAVSLELNDETKGLIIMNFPDIELHMSQLACLILIFMAYRGYIPAIKKTKQFIGFSLNYRFQSDYNQMTLNRRYKLFSVFSMLVIMFRLKEAMQGTDLKSAGLLTTQASEFKSMLLAVLISYLIHLFAIFIIEYKTEKQLRIDKIKVDNG